MEFAFWSPQPDTAASSPVRVVPAGEVADESTATPCTSKWRVNGEEPAESTNARRWMLYSVELARPVLRFNSELLTEALLTSYWKNEVTSTEVVPSRTAMEEVPPPNGVMSTRLAVEEKLFPVAVPSCLMTSAELTRTNRTLVVTTFRLVTV